MSVKPYSRVKYEPLRIKEPYRPTVKSFTDSDDFTVYYREHPDEFKGLSTLRLNKSYKIPGYRISVVKRGTDEEELILKKDYYGGVQSESSNADPSNERISIIEQRLDNIERFLQQLH